MTLKHTLEKFESKWKYGEFDNTVSVHKDMNQVEKFIREEIQNALQEVVMDEWFCADDFTIQEMMDEKPYATKDYTLGRNDTRSQLLENIDKYLNN